MRAAHRFAFAILITSFASNSVASVSKQSYRKDQTFGYIFADPESVDAAIEEGEAAYLAAKTVLGLTGRPFGIVDADYTTATWGSLSPDGIPIYVWTFKKKSNNKSLPPPTYMLRHEIGHDLFTRYLVPSTRSDQYGGDAPDWLDEMAAVAFEGEPLITIRRRSVVRYARESKLIPLQRFLTMTHPEMVSGALPVSPDGESPVFEAVSKDTGPFYATAFAFYEFLVGQTHNADVVAELANAFRNGEPLDRWVIKRAGGKSKNGSLEALNSEFLAWLASDSRYGTNSSR